MNIVAYQKNSLLHTVAYQKTLLHTAAYKKNSLSVSLKFRIILQYSEEGN